MKINLQIFSDRLKQLIHIVIVLFCVQLVNSEARAQDKDSNEQSKQQLEQLQNENRRLKSEFEELSMEVNKLRTENQELHNKVRKLEKDKEVSAIKSTQASGKKDEEIGELNTEIAALTRKLHEADSLIKQANKELQIIQKGNSEPQQNKDDN